MIVAVFMVSSCATGIASAQTFRGKGGLTIFGGIGWGHLFRVEDRSLLWPPMRLGLESTFHGGSRRVRGERYDGADIRTGSCATSVDVSDRARGSSSCRPRDNVMRQANRTAGDRPWTSE